MPTYTYVARDDNGKEHTATMSAKNREEVLGHLRRQGLVLVDLQEKRSLLSLQIGGGAPRVRVKLEEMVIFTRQLSTMISAGIPLLERFGNSPGATRKQRFFSCIG